MGAVIGEKLPVSIRTAADARKLDFGQIEIPIRFFGTKRFKHKRRQSARIVKQEQRGRRQRSERRAGERQLLGFPVVQPRMTHTLRGRVRRRSCRLSEATHACLSVGARN